jgi:hypothetical protein
MYSRLGCGYSFFHRFLRGGAGEERPDFRRLVVGGFALSRMVSDYCIGRSDESADGFYGID